MKIGLDVSKMHALSQTRGIGYYAQNLYHSIKKFTDVEIDLIKEKNSYEKYDLIHFPFFDLFTRSLPLNFSKPFVVTIPDLIPIQFPKHYPPGLRGKANYWFQKQALKKARGIIAISETVKKDVEKILKINPEKVFATLLAPSDIYIKINDQKQLNAIKQKYNLPDEFALYVGNVNWNKNILNMAEACIKSGKNLVIIGSSFFDKTNLNHPEKKSFKTFLEKYEDCKLIRIIDFVPNEELVSIMNLATCLVFASYYEGFGLPILEAQSCGLPVITSNVSATAEISGNSVLLVNPENPDEISKAINTLFNSETERKKLIEKGFQNVKNFSWEKTAKQTVEVYKKCL